MANDLFIWSLKSGIILALLYGGYFLLFKKNSHFKVKRFCVIALMVASLVVPLVEISVSPSKTLGLPSVQQIEKILPQTEQSQRELPRTETQKLSEAPVVLPKATFSWKSLLPIVYVVGILISFSMVVFELSRLVFWSFSGNKRWDLDRRIIQHKKVKSPFSFWKWIFIPQNTNYEANDWAIIEAHENAHLQQKHTFDVVLTSLLQCLFWYNPIIYLVQKEIRSTHEALADEAVLRTTDFQTYARTLLNISIDTNVFKIGHPFALVSSLSKRLSAMKTKKTSTWKTALSITLMASFIFSVTFLNIANGQEEQKSKQGIMGENPFYLLFMFGLSEQLTSKHQEILDKLQAQYPGEELEFRYLSSGNEVDEYLDNYIPNQRTLYFDQMNDELREELTQLVMADTTYDNVNFLTKDKASERIVHFDKNPERIKTTIDTYGKYLVIYQPIPMDSNSKTAIYETWQVDKLPTVVGGIKNLEEAIALDASLPSGISKSDLPEFVEFSFVVEGGHSISHIDLLTELDKNNEKEKEIYRFFGQLHNDMKGKIAAHYAWKKGIKEGKEVKVRVKISIPTKYM